MEGIKSNESPLDFFEDDFSESASLSVVPLNDVVLGVGDCIYVPAFYYVQS